MGVACPQNARAPSATASSTSTTAPTTISGAARTQALDSTGVLPDSTECGSPWHVTRSVGGAPGPCPSGETDLCLVGHRGRHARQPPPPARGPDERERPLGRECQHRAQLVPTARGRDQRHAEAERIVVLLGL